MAHSLLLQKCHIGEHLAEMDHFAPDGHEAPSDGAAIEVDVLDVGAAHQVNAHCGDDQA